LQDRIAEKFQTLIIDVIALLLVPHAGMRQSLFQQRPVTKSVTEAQFQRIHGQRF
jgi:hypothetical protein